MTFKETSVHIRRSFEYKSPDGEEYTITYSEMPDRKYVEIKIKDDEEGKSKVVHDFDLLCGIVDGIREATRLKSKPRRSLQKPAVSDMRSADIQATVEQSMEGYSDDTAARESLTTSNAEFSHEARTGMPFEKSEEIKDTPENWSLEDGDHVPQWKKDAKTRENVSKPETQEKGTSGEGFHRIDPNTLI